MELGYSRCAEEGNEREGDLALLAMQEASPYWRRHLANQWEARTYHCGRQDPAALEMERRMGRDAALARYMLPALYARGESLSQGDPDDTEAMKQAEELYRYRGVKHHRLADQLEAGILGGRPAGSALPPETGVSSEAQRCYELIYFDVRSHLGDRTWIIRHALAELQLMDYAPGTAMTAWGRRARLLAYALGYGEYASWRDGEPSGGALRLLDLLARLDAYLTGLWELGLEGYDDGLKALDWLLGQADRIKAGEVDGDRLADANGKTGRVERLRSLMSRW